MNKLDFKSKKDRAEKISMLTCYDYPSACILAQSTIDCVLVGDSVAMVVHGHDTTITATMDMMVMHTRAVARGLTTQFLISDLPFLSYRMSQSHTLQCVQQLLQAGAHAVKLEGADVDACQTIQHLVTSGVPVMGHIGLTPQCVHQLGGYRVQGREHEQALLLIQQAQRLEEAGCFALVVECIPATLAKTLTTALSIPVIGIGAGADTDGQVLVWHDLLGLQTLLKPRFVKRFADGNALILEAIQAYIDDVQHVRFPALEHVYA